MISQLKKKKKESSDNFYNLEINNMERIPQFSINFDEYKKIVYIITDYSIVQEDKEKFVES